LNRVSDIGLREDQVSVTKTGKNVKTERVDKIPIPARAKKSCYICKSNDHLQYACKSKVKNAIAPVNVVPNMHQNHAPCGKPNCMQCAFNIMHAYINLMNTSSTPMINSNASVKKKHVQAKTPSPPKVRSDLSSPKPDTTVKASKGKEKVESSSNVNDSASMSVQQGKSRSYREAGPNQTWVPKTD
jgi:hypothetical protein